MSTLLTADGIRLRAVHLPRTGPDAGPGKADDARIADDRGKSDELGNLDRVRRDVAIVVGHGFTGSLDRPVVRAVLQRLRSQVGVVGIDFRGHGRSGGVSTVGDREIEDVDAAVRWARGLGYRRVATLGFSMGGAVVLRHGGLRGGVDAVVTVSAPAWWHYRGTVPMRRLHWLIESGSGRAVSRVWRRTRVDRAGWPDPMPTPPDEAAALLAGIPLLVVHGDVDPFFPVAHAHAIFDAASDPKELWIRAGFGHAEGSVDAELVDQIGLWVRRTIPADLAAR